MMSRDPLIPAPAVRRRRAREDHARALRIAASYRVRHARGEAGMLARHAWALAQARAIRDRFHALSAAHAPLG